MRPPRHAAERPILRASAVLPCCGAQDVTVELGDEQFRAHRVLLASQSEVLRAAGLRFHPDFVRNYRSFDPQRPLFSAYFISFHHIFHELNSSRGELRGAIRGLLEGRSAFLAPRLRLASSLALDHRLGLRRAATVASGAPGGALGGRGSLPDARAAAEAAGAGAGCGERYRATAHGGHGAQGPGGDGEALPTAGDLLEEPLGADHEGAPGQRGDAAATCATLAAG